MIEKRSIQREYEVLLPSNTDFYVQPGTAVGARETRRAVRLFVTATGPEAELDIALAVMEILSALEETTE